ncbi:MAG: hypothetical protein IKV57_07565 [Clostridia bacterium]|nr:hypothetical protein [Clostridia bacterium]
MEPGAKQPGREQANPADARAKNKKRIIIGFVVMCILGLVSAVCLQNPQWFELKTETVVNTSMYSDRIVSYNFYPTDYELDVTADEVYMGLDRYVYFKNGNETIAITDGDYAAYNPAVEFFGNYFETVIAGDAETYNTFFTDLYYQTNKPYVQFAPQMLYDIRIEMLSNDPQNDGSVLYAFNVEYKIHRNDGTFRNDIGSDASKKLYFELYEDKEGLVRIDRITYYVR